MAYGTMDQHALPEWVDDADWPIWVTRSDGRFGFVNDAARGLLGDGARSGRRCDCTVRGYTNEGRRVCAERCPLLSAALEGRPQHAWRMHVGDPLDEGSWALVFPMAWRSAYGQPPVLIHNAYCLAREQRMEEYVRRVASRSGDPGDENRTSQLSTREGEILDLLARDIDTHAIAKHLHISYTTVRNHIQHILAKLDVHSMEEAVARWLLDGCPAKGADHDQAMHLTR
jgi:DNA-binding CsgD family transcriptional regulator